MEVIEEKGLKDVMVFQICDSDSVAAYSQDEAREWYIKQTGVSDDELYPYDEVEVISMDHKVYEDDGLKEMITIKEIVKQCWGGEPFIVTTSYY